MKKWAKIIDENNMTCEVGIGNDNEMYRKKGYRYIDVEQGSDGLWYVKGYTPMQLYPTDIELKIEALKRELREYDYIGTKIATGCATIEQYSNEIAHCEELRKEIRRLKGEMISSEDEGAV